MDWEMGSFQTSIRGRNGSHALTCFWEDLCIAKFGIGSTFRYLLSHAQNMTNYFLPTTRDMTNVRRVR